MQDQEFNLKQSWEDRVTKIGAMKTFFELLQQYLQLNELTRRTNESRVFEVYKDPETEHIDYIRRDMNYVEQSFDQADIAGYDPVFKYLETDGTWHDLTLGKQVRRVSDDTDETPFHYADSDIIANGKVIGSVTWTDH